MFFIYLISHVWPAVFFNGPATLTERALYRLSGVPSFLNGFVVFVLIKVVGLITTVLVLAGATFVVTTVFLPYFLDVVLFTTCIFDTTACFAGTACAKSKILKLVRTMTATINFFIVYY